MLRRFEATAVFMAMALAIVLEGALVYWMFQQPLPHSSAHGSLNIEGEWASITLPQGWVLGALFALVYRATAIFTPPMEWTDSDRRHNRRSFLRTWCWIVALVAMQGLVLLLGHSASI